MDQLGAIQAFVRAAEAGSLARAARLLGVTASGVGKSIARLEDELGAKLMHRTTRKIALTEDGAIFFEHCRRVLDDLEAARAVVARRRRSAAGRLRVSMPIALGNRVVLPALGPLLEAHPDLRLSVSLTDRRVALVEERIDVALRIGPVVDASLVARRIGQVELLTVASPRYLARKKLDSPADLDGHRCLVFRVPSTGSERPWHYAVDGHPIEWRPRVWLDVDDGDGLTAAAASALGVTQVPSFMVEEALSSGALVEVLAPFRPPPLPIHAVYVPQKAVPLSTRAFVDFVSTLEGLGERAPAAPAREGPASRRAGARPLPPGTTRPQLGLPRAALAVLLQRVLPTQRHG